MTENTGDTGQAKAEWHYTRCPECSAVFRVNHSKLAVRRGDVRCGSCRGVFHAPSHQVYRNHGGGFSPLISSDYPQQQVADQQPSETLVRSDQEQIPNQDHDHDPTSSGPFDQQYTAPIESAAESRTLFADSAAISSEDDAKEQAGSTRLFADVPEQPEQQTEGETGITAESTAVPAIPKISSQPFSSEPLEDTGVIRQEPVLVLQNESAEQSDAPETPAADNEAPDPRMLLQQGAYIEEVPQFPRDNAQSDDPASINGQPIATYPGAQRQGPKWENARVQPFGASSMAIPPQFDPFTQEDEWLVVGRPAEGRPAEGRPAEGRPAESGEDATTWKRDEDSLLDHNPFARNAGQDDEETDAGDPKPQPVIETSRPAAINMSGVDEYIVDRPNPLAGFFWFLVAAAFVVLLGLQVKFFLVDRFAQNESYRPYLSVFCRVAGCELPPRRDAYRFTITQTRVDLHPREPGALRITVRLLNQATFAQPYPELRVTLTDRVGRVVGRRKFDPDFYLASGAATRLAPGELGYVVFDLAQPHEKAVGFVVDIVRRSS